MKNSIRGIEKLLDDRADATRNAWSFDEDQNIDPPPWLGYLIGTGLLTGMAGIIYLLVDAAHTSL